MSADHTEFDRFAASLSLELDDFQRLACHALEDGQGVLVCAPTGAGKTMVVSGLGLLLGERADADRQGQQGDGEHEPEDGAPAVRHEQAAHDGRHVIIATGTSSGKSLGYQLPALTDLARSVIVSAETFDALLAALDSPPAPNPAMDRAHLRAAELGL